MNFFTLITTPAILTKVRWSEEHFFSFRSALPHSLRRIPVPLTKLRETDGDIILFVPHQTRRPTPFSPFQFYKKGFVHFTKLWSSQLSYSQVERAFSEISKNSCAIVSTKVLEFYKFKGFLFCREFKIFNRIELSYAF